MKRHMQLAGMDEFSAAEMGKLYDQYFEARPAYTAEDHAAVFTLRYKVLCEERLLLSMSQYPNHQEKDEHDEHAVPLMLWHRPTEKLVGCMRLIASDRGNHVLPAFALCPQMTESCEMASTVELSRLVIANQMRRRQGDLMYGRVMDNKEDERRRLPHIMLGLCREALRQIQDRNITHVCAIVEPALHITMKRLGLFFAPAGPAMDFHGLRMPVYAKVSTLLERLRAENPQNWHFVTEGGRLG
ncbi:MAG: PEP-CTERM/exosortase system-associated acyltransferase [Alphaproteobacteria bacterium]|nr:PEP-CTERM/exosortase system-associated acyltransferase [Alphaproteobacteria bacterium]NDC55830.1 PEP-CTERM/exosortase system-associated acyltransferase [Alphaproteobacteria bacterium]NDG04037.1 PEP-CTERM/exosortase system-associated acyltransferase [Alphaproteobacteria bacterium]